MDPGTPKITNCGLQTAEFGDPPLVKSTIIPTNSHKSILTRKQYKRRRMYKLAWKTLLAQFEDGSESEGSDDLLDDSDAEDDMQRATATSERQGPVADEQNDSPDNVAYRAEFYQYVRIGNREQKPQLRKSKEDKQPIPTIQAKQSASKSKGNSIFEVTTMYAIPGGKEISPMISSSTEVLAEIGTYITIRSKMVLAALQDIVGYYPNTSFATDELILQEPFCLLLHYHKEILKRRDELKNVISNANPEDDRGPSADHEHLTYLSEFISQRYSDPVSREMARHQETRPMCTYDWVWLLFKPGTIVHAWREGALTAYVVEHHSRENVRSKDDKIRPPTVSTLDELDRKPRDESLRVTFWCLDFDGETIGRRRDHVFIQSFEGEKAIISLPVFPKEFLKYDKELDGKVSTMEKLIRRGKQFFDMTKSSYMQYDGSTLTCPKRTVRGRVIVDTKHYYAVMGGRPKLGLAGSDERQESDLAASGGSRQKSKRHFENYDNIDPDVCKSLEDDQYLICSYRIWAFVLKSRQWECLNVEHVKEPEFQENLIKDLVLEENAKYMIRGLSQRYTKQKESERTYSADFIADKGEGQIFLLHGKPGVGKTTTAECVAELTRRPLLSLTCGDLGTEPLKVEESLMAWLKLATSWGAILLLDEADVYLESRISQDLQRNTLVSIFLRGLEYYQGILFLTTNRVGTFDDGFVSRIHVAIHYPDFDNRQRGQIWDIFFNKLEKERPTMTFSDRTVEYAKDNKEMQNLGWNGREIRNAFNTAVALAECEADLDAKGKTILHRRHLDQVVKMSRAFRDYLKSTHGMSQGEQARASKVRNDDWKATDQGTDP